MSRIGKKPVVIPSGTKVEVSDNVVSATGSKGSSSWRAPSRVRVSLTEGSVTVEPLGNDRTSRSMWGMTRTMIANLIEGVTEGFVKTLEIQGVGYRAAMQGKNLQLSMGFSHEKIYVAPDDVTLSAPKPTEISVSGIDRRRVGQVAAEIRSVRPPEPYKGKGIRYAGERVYRKEGKKK